MEQTKGLHVGRLTIDLSMRQVFRDGQFLHLTTTEFSLLETLVTHQGVVVTYELLIEQVWGHSYVSLNKGTLRTHMRNLRRKLEDDSANPIITNVSGLGYRFVPPESNISSPADGAVISVHPMPLPFPSPSSAFKIYHLPLPPTSFVGREQEQIDLQSLLQQHNPRLITLTGSGGSGKTRLALEVAKNLIDVFPHGIIFISLASVSTPSMVILTIAQALGIKEQINRSIEEVLKDVLREKQLLLILDNFEQVIPASTSISDLLVSVPSLKVLVTSRVTLHISGEHEYPVLPLSLPRNLRERLAPHEHLTFSSIALFVERAKSVQVNFSLTEENAPVVADICTRLDGLPLAIELAAARIKIFAPQALLTRMQESMFALLTDGPHDAPSRQKTLRSAIAWSYELLSSKDQILFTRIGVFAGGCVIEAAEVVCNMNDGCVIFDGIISLMNQSLLYQQQEPDGNPRFFMLETIREYALEQLTMRGERELLEQNYADYYVNLVECAEPELANDPQWVHLLDREYDNIRTVLEWSIEHDRQDIGMRISGSLWRFWYIRGNIMEGRQWFNRVLDNSETLLKALRARAFDGAGVLAMAQGQYVEAQQYHEIALRIYEDLGDAVRTAGNLESLGHIWLYLRDYEKAVACYESGLTIRQNSNDMSGIAASFNSLGSIAILQGNYHNAQDYMEEALKISRDIGNIQETVVILSNLAAIAYYQGDFNQSLHLYKESLIANHQLGSTDSIITCLEGIALIFAAIDEIEQTALLFGAVAQLREISGLFAYNSSHDLIIQTINDGRQTLGQAWEEFWSNGQTMTSDQVVRYALVLSLPGPHSSYEGV